MPLLHGKSFLLSVSQKKLRISWYSQYKMYRTFIQKNSDIDIAVIFNGFSGDWLKTSGDLWRITEKADTIIEPVLLDMQNDPSIIHDNYRGLY